MRVRCIKTCFYAGRLWTAGEIMRLEDSAKIPAHFEVIKKPIEPTKKDQKQIEEEAKIVAEKMAAAVGHGKSKKAPTPEKEFLN